MRDDKKTIKISIQRKWRELIENTEGVTEMLSYLSNDPILAGTYVKIDGQ